MTSEELLQKVRRIEIKTRGLSKQIFAGEYHSQFKGRGMAFSEVREYQFGDDVRAIDWNVTARLNKPYIKVFEEERELTVMLLIDMSGSRDFATRGEMKRDMMAEIAATLAFSTIENNDKVGVVFFTDKIEKYIPAKKGKQHVLRIIRELLEFEPTSKGTNVAGALQYFANAQKRHCTAFVVSDLLTDIKGIEALYKPLLITSGRHDLQVIQVYDHRDSELPDVGLLKVRDAETGERYWIDTSLKSVRDDYKNSWVARQSALDRQFTRTGTRWISVRTDDDWVAGLRKLFKVA